MEWLHRVFDRIIEDTVSYNGKCHDCGADVIVYIEPGEDGFDVQGGAVYNVKDTIFLKCDPCYATAPKLGNYQNCEVYSRVVGYLRPTSQWNEGKLAEFRNRVNYKVGE